MEKVKITIEIGNSTMQHEIDFARWYYEMCNYDSEEYSYHDKCLPYVVGFASGTIKEMLRDFSQKHGKRVEAERKIIRDAYKRLEELNKE